MFLFILILDDVVVLRVRIRRFRIFVTQMNVISSQMMPTVLLLTLLATWPGNDIIINKRDTLKLLGWFKHFKSVRLH